MRTYELVLVLRPVAEGERNKALEAIKALLKDLKVTKEEAWGSKALKYAIKKELTGYYYDIELEGEIIPAGFETRLINNDVVLRHLVIRQK